MNVLNHLNHIYTFVKGAFLTLCIFSFSEAQATQYTIQDIGTIPGGTTSEGTGINNFGQVTGFGDDANGNFHGFLYTNGTITDLGVISGISSNAREVNDMGQVTGGAAAPPNGIPHVYLWSPNSNNSSSGVMYDLGTLGGRRGQGLAINDSGQITGFANLSNNASHAFLWSPNSTNGNIGLMKDLGTLGGASSSGNDINNFLQIAGSANQVNGDNHAVLWTNCSTNNCIVSDLGTLSSGTYSIATGINDNGWVVGLAEVTDSSANSHAHAFLWKPNVPNGTTGTMQSLGTLCTTSNLNTCDKNSRAEAINNNGQIVGSTHKNDLVFSFQAFTHSSKSGYPLFGLQSHAVIWENQTISDLQTLIPSNSGWILLNAEDINDSGQIVGSGYNCNPQTPGCYAHAYLMTPIGP